jgi:hypothetical protein
MERPRFQQRTTHAVQAGRVSLSTNSKISLRNLVPLFNLILFMFCFVVLFLFAGTGVACSDPAAQLPAYCDDLLQVSRGLEGIIRSYKGTKKGIEPSWAWALMTSNKSPTVC